MELTVLTKRVGKERELLRKESELFDRWGDMEVATLLEPSMNFVRWLERTGIPYRVTKLDGVSYCVIHRDLRFYEPFRKSSSQGSDAIYLARSRDEMEGLLLQYLPPYSKTSRHSHKKMTEIYYGLEGCCWIEVDGNDIPFEKCSYRILPKSSHQLKTDREPSLTLIEFIGDPKGISMDDIHYANTRTKRT